MFTGIVEEVGSVASRVRATYPMNPPAKLSPAPVGSFTASSGYDGAEKWTPGREPAACRRAQPDRYPDFRA